MVTYRRWAALVVLPIVLTMTACSRAPMPSAPVTVGSVVFRPVGEDTAASTVHVPLTEDLPGTGGVDLYVGVHWADSPPDPARPVLFVGPGGPGFPQSGLALDAKSWLSTRILGHYNVIGIDVRGSGKSTPAFECGIDPKTLIDQPVFAHDVASIEAMQRRARQFSTRCSRAASGLGPTLTLDSTVRDHEAVRQAMGVGAVDMLGLSQSGTVGLAWAARFPGSVGQVVADGSPSPAASAVDESVSQARGLQRQLDRFLGWCAKSSCLGVGDARSTIRNLLDTVDTTGSISSGLLATALVQGLYSDQADADLATALNDAVAGDFAKVDTFVDYFVGSGHDLESFYGYSCTLPGSQPNPQERRSYEAQLKAVAPDLWPYFAHDYTCDDWPFAVGTSSWQPRRISARTLVVASTSDPVTAYQEQMSVASSISGSQVLSTSFATHTSYSSSPCVRDAVDDFLLTSQREDHRVC